MADRSSGGKRRKAGAGGSPPVRAIERAGRVLETLLGAPPHGLGLAEIAEQAGLHKTTALRLLRSLIAIRVVRRLAGSDRYSWDALHWLAVARRIRATASGPEAVQAVLDGLAAASGETAGLSYLEIAKRRVLFVAAAASPSPLRIDPVDTHSWPLHTSAPGKVCLAQMSEPELQQYAARGLAPMTDRSITSLPALARELATIRDQGFAVSREEGLAGAIGVAVPVRSDTGDVMAAVGLAAPVQRATEAAVRKWVGLLNDASRELTHVLYAAPPATAERPNAAAPQGSRPAGSDAPPQRARRSYRVV